MNKNCSTCKWYKCEPFSEGFVCVNGDSEYCTEFTECTDWCDEWEGKA